MFFMDYWRTDGDDYREKPGPLDELFYRRRITVERLDNPFIGLSYVIVVVCYTEEGDAEEFCLFGSLEGDDEFLRHSLWQEKWIRPDLKTQEKTKGGEAREAPRDSNGNH